MPRNQFEKKHTQTKCFRFGAAAINCVVVLCVCIYTDVREVFDLFDFWDGRDGLVDGFKLGDFLRCCGLNPTQAVVFENGGTKKLGIII